MESKQYVKITTSFKKRISFGHAIVFYFEDDYESQQCRRSCDWQAVLMDNLRFKHRVNTFEDVFNRRSPDKWRKMVMAS